jgi:hypothetical protein
MIRKFWTRVLMLLGVAGVFGVASAASPAPAKAQPVVVVGAYIPQPPVYVYPRPDYYGPYWRRDWYWRREHGWREHEWREHEWREHAWREHEWREHHGWR